MHYLQKKILTLTDALNEAPARVMRFCFLTADDALPRGLILYMTWRGKKDFAQLPPTTYKGEGARALEQPSLSCLC